MVLWVGCLLGLGAGLAVSGRPAAWPVIALVLVAGCTVGIYAAELRFSDHAVDLWEKDGGPLFHWLRVWIPLGRIVAPAVWLAVLLNPLIFTLPLVDRAVPLASGAVLLSTMVWRWRHLEMWCAGMVLAFMAWWIAAHHIVTSLSLWSLVFGVALLALTHPAGNPRWLKQNGWRQFALWISVLVLSAAAVWVLRRDTSWIPPPTRVLVWPLLLAGVVLWRRPKVKASTRAATAALGMALAIVPLTSVAAAAGLTWLAGQSAAALLLWGWLRLNRPYMMRWNARWAAVIAGVLSLGLVMLFWELPSALEWREMGGWALWFLVPPIIDAYRTGRFPFRRPIFPETHSWADL